MRRFPLGLLAGLTCFVALAGAANAATSTAKTVINSKTTALTIIADYAADAVPASPLYHGQTTSGTNALYEGSGKVISPPGANPVGEPALSSFGAAFQSVTPGEPTTNGLFVRPAGGVVITIIGRAAGDASGAPTMNASGEVAFKSIDDAGNVSISAASPPGGGTPITIRGLVTRGPGADLSRPAINDAGDVCFTENLGGSSSALYVYPKSGGTPLTISGNQFRLSNPSYVGRRLIATATYSDGTSEPLGFTIDTTGPTASAVGPLKWMAPESILHRTFSLSPNGDVAVCDGQSLLAYSGETIWSTSVPAGGSSDVLDALPPPPTPLVQSGDSLDLSTIDSLSLASQSWVGNDVIFFAHLTDGTTGLYSITAVPEPAIVGTLAAAVIAAAARYRRRPH